MKQQHQRQVKSKLDDFLGKQIEVAGKLWTVKRRVKLKGKPKYYFFCVSERLYGSSLYQVDDDLVIFDLRLGDSKNPDKRYYLWDLESNKIVELKGVFSLREARQKVKEWVKQVSERF